MTSTCINFKAKRSVKHMELEITAENARRPSVPLLLPILGKVMKYVPVHINEEYQNNNNASVQEHSGSP